VGILVPAGEWLPDQVELGNPGATVAKNVIPWVGNSYKSFPQFTVLSSAIHARAQGGCFARDKPGNVYNFVGTDTKLLQLVGTSYSDVTRTTGAYSTATDEWWEFAQWGDTLLATNFADDVQTISLGTANFAALAGTPPKARHIAVVRDFVVLGNVDDGTQYPKRVQWSGINNNTQWTPSLNTLSDYQDLEGEGGWVQKVVGGEFGLVFTERSIYRMTFSGYPTIFQFDEIEKARGAYAPQSVIKFGPVTFYLAEDGFYATAGSGESIPIGDGRVDKFFLNDLNSFYSYRINARVDPLNKLVMWAYPGSGSTLGLPNKIIIYNIVRKKWSIVEVETEMLPGFASEGYTLDELDAITTDLDALSPSLDSRVWTGGAQTLAAFDSSHRLGTFSGTAMDATVETMETQHFPGHRAHVTGARPLVDGNSASVAVGSRDLLSASESFGTAKSQNSSGVCQVRSNARYQRYRIATTGAFNFIQGVEVDAVQGEKR
jgi:hypothetical protein